MNVRVGSKEKYKVGYELPRTRMWSGKYRKPVGLDMICGGVKGLITEVAARKCGLSHLFIWYICIFIGVCCYQRRGRDVERETEREV